MRCNFGTWNQRSELRVRSDRINHLIHDSNDSRRIQKQYKTEDQERRT